MEGKKYKEAVQAEKKDFLQFKHADEIRPKAWKFWHQDFIPKGCVILLAGAGGSGKSTFMSWLAEKVSGPNCKVGIMSNEETDETLASRASLYDNEVHFLSRFSRPGQKKIGEEEILEALTMFDVLFVDSFRTITNVDFRQSHLVEQALEPYIKAVSGTDKSLVLLTHTNKGGGNTLQDMIAGSERLVSAVRHCDLAFYDEVGDRRIITVVKSNCFSDSKASHSYIIQAKDRVFEDGGIVKVIDGLYPFVEDMQEVIWRNSPKGKAKLYERNLLREAKEEEKIQPPKFVKKVLLESKGEDITPDTVKERLGSYAYQAFVKELRNGAEGKWVQRSRNKVVVTYHWTEEALEWLREQDEDYPF